MAARMPLLANLARPLALFSLLLLFGSDFLQDVVAVKMTRSRLRNKITEAMAHAKAVSGFFPELHLVVQPSFPGRNSTTPIQDAINVAMNSSASSALILILPGYYSEKVHIPKHSHPVIMLQGLDPFSTIISYDDWAGKTYPNGSSIGTLMSCSVCISVDMFFANNLTFQNKAALTFEDPDWLQWNGMASAVTIESKFAAFYNCRFLGFQDTLYDYKGSHYYSHCYFEGTVDFICGGATTIFESCTFFGLPRDKDDALAAQRRMVPESPSGFVFLRSNITADSKLLLGRAWGPYSRVVLAYCFIDDLTLGTQGAWDDWGDPVRQQTVMFAEYNCWGPGANISSWVPWAHELNGTEAAPFLSYEFIKAASWLGPPPPGSVLQPVVHFRSPFFWPNFTIPDIPSYPYWS